MCDENVQDAVSSCENIEASENSHDDVTSASVNTEMNNNNSVLDDEVIENNIGTTCTGTVCEDKENDTFIASPHADDVEQINKLNEKNKNEIHESDKSIYELFNEKYKTIVKSAYSNVGEKFETIENEEISKPQILSILQDLVEYMEDKDLKHENYLRFLGMKAFLNHIISRFSEEIESIKILETIYDEIKPHLYEPEITYTGFLIINSLATLKQNKCSSLEDAKNILEDCQTVYRTLKFTNKDCNCYSGNELFSNEENVFTSNETKLKFEKLVITNLLMLASIHDKLGDRQKEIVCYHTAFNRMLNKGLISPFKWVEFTTRLACVFIDNNNFKDARHHLAAATHIHEVLEVKYAGTCDLLKKEAIKKNSLHISLAWVRYCILIFEKSKDEDRKQFSYLFKKGFIDPFSQERAETKQTSECSINAENIGNRDEIKKRNCSQVEIEAKNTNETVLQENENAQGDGTSIVDKTKEEIETSSVIDEKVNSDICDNQEKENHKHSDEEDIDINQQEDRGVTGNCFGTDLEVQQEGDNNKATNCTNNLQTNHYHLININSQEEGGENMKSIATELQANRHHILNIVDRQGSTNSLKTTSELQVNCYDILNETKKYASEVLAKGCDSSSQVEHVVSCIDILSKKSNCEEEYVLSKHESVNSFDVEVINSKSSQIIQEEVAVFDRSSDEMDEDVAEEEIEESETENESGIIVLEGSLTMDPLMEMQFEATKDLTFKSLGYLPIEHTVTKDLIQTPKEARNLFNFAYSWSKQAQRYYTKTNDFYSYVHVTLNLISLYRLCAYFQGRDNLEFRIGLEQTREELLDQLSAELSEVQPQGQVHVRLYQEMSLLNLDLAMLNMCNVYNTTTDNCYKLIGINELLSHINHVYIVGDMLEKSVSNDSQQIFDESTSGKNVYSL